MGEEDPDFTLDPSGLKEDSDDDSTEDGEEETSDPGSEWSSKERQISWSPSNAEMFRYTPAPAIGFAVSWIGISLDLFITEDMQLVMDMTNLQGRRTQANWREVDAAELQGFIGLLILAGVFRSWGESTCSLWDENTGWSIFRATISRK